MLRSSFQWTVLWSSGFRSRHILQNGRVNKALESQDYLGRLKRSAYSGQDMGLIHYDSVHDMWF